MNVVEAVRQAGDSWFRPVSWRGRGVAYVSEHGLIYMVPDKRGGSLSMTASVRELTEEWEIVSPDTVLEEQ